MGKAVPGGATGKNCPAGKICAESEEKTRQDNGIRGMNRISSLIFKLVLSLPKEKAGDDFSPLVKGVRGFYLLLL